MSDLLADARPRQDLADILTQMAPASIFGRSKGKRPKGGYYLLPLLRHIKNHIVSIFLVLYVPCAKLILQSKSGVAHQVLATYFDENMALLLPYGRWKRAIFRRNDEIKTKEETAKRVLKSNESDSSDSMVPLMSVSSSSEDESEDYDSSDDDSDVNEQSRRAQTKNSQGSKPVNHYVPDVIPFVAFAEWDEVRDKLNISLKGPDVLVGLCDEAEFARTRLPGTLSAILTGSVQVKASIFCLNEIKSSSIRNDARIAFGKLLSQSLSHSQQASNLTASIEDLLTKHPNICKKLPSVTMQAISKYLDSIPSRVGPTKPTTSANERRTTQNSSQTRPGHAEAIPKAPAAKKASQASAVPGTSGRTGKKPTSAASPSVNTVNTKTSTQPPMRPQPIRRPFLVPSSRSVPSTSPGSSQKGSTPSQTASTTDLGSGSHSHSPSSSRSSAPVKKSLAKAQPSQASSQKPSIPPLQEENDGRPFASNTEPVELGSIPQTQSQSSTSQISNSARKKKGESRKK